MNILDSNKKLQPKTVSFSEDFTPDLTPAEMLELGVFGGCYDQGQQFEFPAAWLQNVRLPPNHLPDKKYNYFQVLASNPSLFGKRRAGFTQPIPWAGFSGIAVTTRAGVFRAKTSAK